MYFTHLEREREREGGGIAHDGENARSALEGSLFASLRVSSSKCLKEP